MGNGWKEVARLGGPGARYPQILVDGHGWCLRLGRHTRHDEKYYSSLPNLLGGLIEHTIRRRLMNSPAAQGLAEFVTRLRQTLDVARSLCLEALEKGGLEEHIRRLDARKAAPTTSGSLERLPGGLAATKPSAEPEPVKKAV